MWMPSNKEMATMLGCAAAIVALIAAVVGFVIARLT